MILFVFFTSRRRHTKLQGDWSSDVCSSDLDRAYVRCRTPVLLGVGGGMGQRIRSGVALLAVTGAVFALANGPVERHKIGRASCRERVEDEKMTEDVK